MQRFRTMHGLKALVFVERAGLAHEVGEIVLESGGTHAVRAGTHRVSDGSADRAHRRFSVESAEDVARAESYE